MNTNSQNPAVGREFQTKVCHIAEERFKIDFDEECAIQIGNPPKDHKYDIVAEDKSIVIECKCYVWTKGNNSPSAKMATLNEAVFYMTHLPERTKKIIAMKKDINPRTAESLASYYVRRYGHLLRDVEIWEVDSDGNVTIIK